MDRTHIKLDDNLLVINDNVICFVSDDSQLELPKAFGPLEGEAVLCDSFLGACENLEEVTVEEGVKLIKNRAFCNTKRLKRVHLKSFEIKMEARALEGVQAVVIPRRIYRSELLRLITLSQKLDNSRYVLTEYGLAAGEFPYLNVVSPYYDSIPLNYDQIVLEEDCVGTDRLSYHGIDCKSDGQYYRRSCNVGAGELSTYDYDLRLREIIKWRKVKFYSEPKYVCMFKVLGNSNDDIVRVEFTYKKVRLYAPFVEKINYNARSYYLLGRLYPGDKKKQQINLLLVNDTFGDIDPETQKNVEVKYRLFDAWS